MHQQAAYHVGGTSKSVTTTAEMVVDPTGKDRCCCGSFHVQRGAFIIGIIGIVGSALGIVGAIAGGNYTIVIYLISLFAHVALVMAQSRQQPRLYVPFLVLNGISVVLTPLYILAGIAAFVFMPQLIDSMGQQVQDAMQEAHQKADYTRDQLINLGRIVSAIVVVAGTIGELLSVWFQMVVYRAYKTMKASLLSQPFVPYSAGIGTYNKA